MTPFVDVWDAYCTVRLLALTIEVTEIEQAVAVRTAGAVSGCLGVGSSEAQRVAERGLLYRRELTVHELLAMSMPGSALREIVDAMEVDGEDRLRDAQQRAGVVLISLHYSLYSSLLVLWLSRAVVRGLLRDLTVLVVSTPTGQLRPAPERLDHLRQADLWPTGPVLLDRRVTGGTAAARILLTRLRAGGTVLILPDATVHPAGANAALTVRVGAKTLGLPPGAGWLASQAPAPVLSVHVGATGRDRYAITFGTPISASSVERVQAVLQTLIDTTVLVDPAPWEGWLRDNLSATAR